MLSMKKRLDKLFENSNVDAILLMNTGSGFDPNFLYLTGFTSGRFERDILVVTPTKEILLTSSLEYETAKRQKTKEMQVINARSSKQWKTILKKLMKGKVVGINGGVLPYNSYKALKKLTKAKRFVDVTKIFYNARSIKDESEIKSIRAANRIIMKALKSVQKFFKEGMTEKELASKVDQLMVEYGADGPSFPTIVCFGETSSLPHHMPENRRLQKSSFILIDCGSIYKNYCSDVTRTFIFKPDKKSSKYTQMLEMYNIVKEAQRLAFLSMKPGTKCNVPHNIASNYINKAAKGKYKGKFIHSLGHAIGIEVHDLGPGLYPSSKERMEPGMVFSDEPGIYIPGFGGVRIEDDVLITKKGAVII